MNYGIWDIEHGTCIKLGENKEVAAAVMGYDVLSKDAIQAIYGTPPVYGALKIPKYSKYMEREKGAHRVFQSLSECY